jgi:hypothetical protein
MRRSFEIVGLAVRLNAGLDHLFMICSNIKLIGSGESTESRI